MSDADRILGVLLEFKKNTTADLAELKKDVKSLQRSRWRVAGGAVVFSFMLTGFVECFHLWVEFIKL